MSTLIPAATLSATAPNAPVLTPVTAPPAAAPNASTLIPAATPPATASNAHVPIPVTAPPAAAPHSSTLISAATPPTTALGSVSPRTTTLAPSNTLVLGLGCSSTAPAPTPSPNPPSSTAASPTPTSPTTAGVTPIPPATAGAGVPLNHTPSLALPATNTNTNETTDTSSPVVSRAGRLITPSTRHEKLNEIGTANGKGNKPPPAAVEPTTAETPDWMTEAQKYLVGLGLGNEWNLCVDMWERLELVMEYGAKTKGGLPEVKMRPAEWSKWTSKGRNGVRAYNLSPELVQQLDVDDFGVAFTKWWHRMQPPFRHGNDFLPVAAYIPVEDVGRDVWEGLRKGGPNGLVTVITMLGWWGRKGSTDPNWQAAVIDIRRTLERMMPVGTKRTGEGGGGSQKRLAFNISTIRSGRMADQPE
ncbi:hypothetical protein BD779DRAFT_1676284 [Infundibulicybe gibba]|nr:hypothetical protein BD779DRAFT_1676284 [Infundibulicybe gibba]